MSEQLFYEIIVTDKFGKVIAREQRESRSYLKAYNQMVLYGMSHGSAGVVSIKSIDNTDLNANCTTPLFAIPGMDRGILVGSGNTAVDISDYKLETRIVDGMGVGQISHQALAIGRPTVGATESAFTVTRLFINHSGGDITVWEIGIYAYYTNVAPNIACIVRDVLGGAVVVPDGGAISVTYTVKAVE